MTTNKPEVVMTLLGGEQLIRLSDYERLQADRDQQYDMKAKAREQRDAVTAKLKALQAECEKLRKDAEMWEPIISEIHRRAGKEHAMEDRCDFTVTVAYEDYAAIDAAMEGDKS